MAIHTYVLVPVQYTCIKYSRNFPSFILYSVNHTFKRKLQYIIYVFSSNTYYRPKTSGPGLSFCIGSNLFDFNQNYDFFFSDHLRFLSNLAYHKTFVKNLYMQNTRTKNSGGCFASFGSFDHLKLTNFHQKWQIFGKFIQK